MTLDCVRVPVSVGRVTVVLHAIGLGTQKGVNDLIAPRNLSLLELPDGMHDLQFSDIAGGNGLMSLNLSRPIFVNVRHRRAIPSFQPWEGCTTP